MKNDFILTGDMPRGDNKCGPQCQKIKGVKKVSILSFDNKDFTNCPFRPTQNKTMKTFILLAGQRVIV